MTNPSSTVMTVEPTVTVKTLKLSKPLSEGERDALHVELEQVTRRISRVEEERRETLREYRESLKEDKDVQKNILQKLANGETMDDVECEIEWHWEEGKKFIRRKDTGAMVYPDGLKISETERQMQLAGLEPEEFDANRSKFEGGGSESSEEPQEETDPCAWVHTEETDGETTVSRCVLPAFHDGPHDLVEADVDDEGPEPSPDEDLDDEDLEETEDLPDDEFEDDSDDEDDEDDEL